MLKKGGGARVILFSASRTLFFKVVIEKKNDSPTLI
jgi:hypothetical protein